MSLTKEFKAFALKGNVIDLAVAVVLGGAFGAIVKALVDDVIMPVVGGLFPSRAAWETYTVTSLHLRVGHLASAVLSFLLIAAALFFLVVKVMGALNKKQEPTKTTKQCAECMEMIPIEARRCRACTSPA